MVNAQGYQAPARAPRARPRLRTFERVASLVSASVITLFAILAPNTMTTWRDAWGWSVGAGILAGLLAVWLSRPRRPGSWRLLDWIAGLAVVSLAAGIFCGRRRLL
jgi:hypothetical protein